MDNLIKSSTLIASRMLLRHVASLLLKCGVTWKEFSELSKWIFVNVASKEFGIKGRPTNISRISMLTGISRKEVKRQRELEIKDNEKISTKTTDATRLLYNWHHDPEFSDSTGNAKILNLNSGANSFFELHKKYGGDIPQPTMLKELVKTGSVRLVEKKSHSYVEALQSYYSPKSMDSEMLLHFGRTLRDHAATLNINVTSEKNKDKRFEGYATVVDVDKKFEKDFKQYIEKKGQEFLDEVDAWLNQHRALETDTDSKTIRLGVGAYAIHGAQDEEN